jgi:8-oxo-dGTP pyrophosphatase MutT (NUDIX family)
MPHIHTEPGQHDMTVSAYIVRKREDGEWLCLVHMHRKIDMLMQVGGHIELDQTPWQAMAAELHAEAGYSLNDVRLLQWTLPPTISRAITHPQPLLMNTHTAGEGHFHSDTCYGFVAQNEPPHTTADGESDDLRWVSLKELQVLADQGEALRDVAEIYEYFLTARPKMIEMEASDFSLAKPEKGGITYKR